MTSPTYLNQEKQNTLRRIANSLEVVQYLPLLGVTSGFLATALDHWQINYEKLRDKDTITFVIGAYVAATLTSLVCHSSQILIRELLQRQQETKTIDKVVE